MEHAKDVIKFLCNCVILSVVIASFWQRVAVRVLYYFFGKMERESGSVVR
jgi:hypothetical protein